MSSFVVSPSPTVNMPSPPRSNASRTASRRRRQQCVEVAGLRACGLRRAACARRCWRRRRAATGRTSSIATGVFCTIVSSSSSRCTSARRCSRSARRARCGWRPDRRVRRALPRQAEAEIAVAIAGDACRRARGTASASARTRGARGRPAAAPAPATASSARQPGCRRSTATAAARAPTRPPCTPARWRANSRLSGMRWRRRMVSRGSTPRDSMPRRSRRRYSAWRDKPSSAAACATTPPLRCSAASIAPRSGSSDVGAARRAAPAGRGRRRRGSSLRRQQAPRAGSCCAVRARCPASDGASSARSASSPSCLPGGRKWRASGRMSSRRSASGGNASSIALRR